MRKQTIDFNLDYNISKIKGDPNRLMQLFSNLLTNAIKFSPDESVISIFTRTIDLSENNHVYQHDPTHSEHGIKYKSHRYIELKITDSGIGINREDQLRIFDKFYEVGNIEEHSSGKVGFKSRGAGLGLAIAKGVVELHNGKIWVESLGYDQENFPGSTFFVLLPLSPVNIYGEIDYMHLF